ncbi:polyprenyl synthetase [Cohnella sp. CIP 111063]|uniref:polyprenyl synthetase family protein n=1 Tax=unclassified Cohnella TaxID=2636738 RepID=UPI000B9CB1C5|nr:MULTISPECIES: farnesyl diphosphate synthase [unclassified Cohnella]OXS52406.1 polyprenyl synthetase [Cohnella sp. CIP 111063]PRX58264.1 geranylgeranyl diphosphate synthase type II [Cohnella sp. SGD-V74]
MKTSVDLHTYLQEQRERVEDALRNVFPEDWPIPGRLREAMDYSLLAGGKRLRPILALAAAEAVSGREETSAKALAFACAVEMIHTYSLIHDDLPAMDNDDYRRGRPTNHKVFGDAMAILAGDGLLTHAFHVASRASEAGVPAERVLAVVRELSRFAGLPGMVGGQVSDMLGEQGITSLEQLEHIHLHKTSDLISFSLRSGGHAAEADDRQLEALGRFGRNVGLAFQIQDDILDLTGSADKLGKPVKSDERQQKVTYPYLLGLEESRRRVSELTCEAADALLQAGLAKPDRLLEIADYLLNRDH